MIKTQCACGSTAVGDAYLCKRCTHTLATNLRNLVGLVNDLRTTAYRQDHVSAGNGGFAAPDRVRPLPYKPKAAALLPRAYRLIRAWTGVRPVERYRHEHALHDLHNLARAAPLIALQINAPDIAEDVAQLTHDIRALVDLPDDTHRLLGPCDACEKPMYVPRDATTYACTTTGCVATYHVERRISTLLKQSRDVVASPATIATALTSLDQPVTAQDIYRWKDRGQLTPRTSVNGHHWYRLGDVLDLLAARYRAELKRHS
jgi:hypothetical protein